MNAITKWQELSAELERLCREQGDPEWRYVNAVQFAMSSVLIDLLVETGLVSFEDVYERAGARMQVLVDDYRNRGRR